MSRTIGRTSIGLFMVFIGLFAGGLAAARSGSDLAEQAVYTLVLLVLGIGLLGAIVRRGEPAWLGFALFGCGSFMLSTSLPLIDADFGPRLIWTELSTRLAVELHPVPRFLTPPTVPASLRQMDPGPLSQVRPGDPYWSTLASSQREELLAYQRAIAINRAAMALTDSGRRNATDVLESMVTLACAIAGSIIAPILAAPRQSTPDPRTPG